MRSHFGRSSERDVLLFLAIGVAMGLLFAIATQQVFAQTSFGTLSNFDVFNDTGQEVHGFEIELDGISSADVVHTFGYIRYGNPTVTDFPGGVYIRYESPYDPVNHVFTQTTPVAPAVIAATNGDACWTGGSGSYLTSGCEHFGVSISGNPTKTVYRWLVADPGNPGNLIPANSKVSIPSPAWNVLPSPQGGAPVVQAVLPAETPEVNVQYGDAMWVKVFVTELPEPAQLDHLVTDDPSVPQNAGETEVEWTILQGGPNGAANAELANEGQIGTSSQSVIRRYEFYEYTGAYDPETHEVLCGGDGSCNQPLVGEIGNYIGAQIAGINLVVEPPVPLVLALAAVLPAGELGVPYDAPLASGGTPPYNMIVSKGKLPAGLSIDSNTGRLSGTPTATGSNAKFTIQVTDQSATSVTGTFSVKIMKAIRITTRNLRPGKNTKVYKGTVKATLGKSPYTWALIGGSLPAGLILDSATGTILGVPAAPGSFEFTLQVTDSLGGEDQESFTLTIN